MPQDIYTTQLDNNVYMILPLTLLTLYYLLSWL